MLGADGRQAHRGWHEKRVLGLLERREQQVQQAIRTNPITHPNY